MFKRKDTGYVCMYAGDAYLEPSAVLVNTFSTF